MADAHVYRVFLRGDSPPFDVKVNDPEDAWRITDSSPWRERPADAPMEILQKTTGSFLQFDDSAQLYDGVTIPPVAPTAVTANLGFSDRWDDFLPITQVLACVYISQPNPVGATLGDLNVWTIYFNGTDETLQVYGSVYAINLFNQNDRVLHTALNTGFCHKGGLVDPASPPSYAGRVNAAVHTTDPDGKHYEDYMPWENIRAIVRNNTTTPDNLVVEGLADNLVTEGLADNLVEEG